MSECYLVKVVGDIVRKSGSDSEYKIIAMKGGLAWVEHVGSGVSNLEPIDNLEFVRGDREEEFEPGSLVTWSADTVNPQLLFTDAGSGFPTVSAEYDFCGDGVVGD